MKSPRLAARALLVRDGALLTIQGYNPTHGEFYVLPGGGQQFGETLPETLVRECREELGIEVEPGELCFVHDYISARDTIHYGRNSDAHQVDMIFHARILSGEPGCGGSPDTYQIGLRWLPIDRIEEFLLYPRLLCRWLNRPDHPIYLDFNQGM